MNVHQIVDINQYVRYLQENSHEIDLLFKELLIGVTSFFREPDAFVVLKEKVILELLKTKKRGDSIRVWVVGCSTGEEAYSIAIVLRECLDDLLPRGNFKIQIYATDIDKDAIDLARQGTYPANISRRCVTGAFAAIFYRRERSLSHQERDQGLNHLCAAEHSHRPAFHQARPTQLPKPSHLSELRDAKEAPATLPLLPESWRISFPRLFRVNRRLHRSLLSAGQQMEGLQAQGDTYRPQETDRIPHISAVL